VPRLTRIRASNEHNHLLASSTFVAEGVFLNDSKRQGGFLYARSRDLASFGAIVTMGPFPFLGSRRVSQQEILEHELAFATGKRTTAGTARNLAIDRFRSSFDFDDLIQRIAVWAMECSLACNHDPPPQQHLILLIGVRVHSFCRDVTGLSHQESPQFDATNPRLCYR
jgi:hypothetical protein